MFDLEINLKLKFNLFISSFRFADRLVDHLLSFSPEEIVARQELLHENREKLLYDYSGRAPDAFSYMLDEVKRMIITATQLGGDLRCTEPNHEFAHRKGLVQEKVPKENPKSVKFLQSLSNLVSGLKNLNSAMPISP